MISAPDRRETLQLIEDAVAAGARRAQACAELGLSLRSLQRWQHCPEDRRPSAQRAEPANKLTPQERRRVLEVANQPEFASLPPQQIVARLADQGTWLASESTFYRLLKDAEQQHPRGRSRPPVKRALTTHVADGPNQLWCWDITWLPTTVSFVAWYNHEHRHSALKFVTPAQRHTGQAEELLRKRIELYEAARARHPERWSGNIRNWVLAPIVCLNPEREAVLQQTSKAA
ncbi:hypothetical protein JF55_11210 [Pseudomonas sp. 1-7]|nr:hypothetical protein JF55_11210 [Pseudomonas sp. 1-7]